MTPREEIGACLRALRVLRGWNQRQAAAAARLPLTRLSDYESGKTSPQVEKLEAIVHALGYPMLSLEIARQLVRTVDDRGGSHGAGGGRVLELRGQAHEIPGTGLAVGVFVLPPQAADRRGRERSRGAASGCPGGAAAPRARLSERGGG